MRAPAPFIILLTVGLAGATVLAACGDAADGMPTAALEAQSPAAAGGSAAPAEPGASGAISAPSGAPADPAAIAAARALLDASRLDDPATLDALAAARFDDGAPEAAAQALADGVTGDARWAAVWTYASSGTDATVLQPILADQDASLRAIAAAALTAWGDPAGIPALAALVGLPDRLAGSYPPTTVGDFAAGSLARFVTGPSIEPDAAPTEQAAAWGSWLTEHDPASLVFDPESGTWSAS